MCKFLGVKYYMAKDIRYALCFIQVCRANLYVVSDLIGILSMWQIKDWLTADNLLLRVLEAFDILCGEVRNMETRDRAPSQNENSSLPGDTEEIYKSEERLE